MKRILLLVAMICCVLLPMPAKAQNNINSYSVKVNNCTARELVISFSRPITDKRQSVMFESEQNGLTKRLKKTKLSEVFMVDPNKIGVSFNAGEQRISFVIKEVIGILADHDKSVSFESDDRYGYQFEQYLCEPPQGYRLHFTVFSEPVL